MRDQHSHIGVVVPIVPAVQAATIEGDVVDLLGFNAATVIIPSGAIASSGNFTAKLQESDTTTGGDFTDVAAGDLIGTFPEALSASTVIKIGYKGTKRYIRPVLTKNSGTSIAAGAVVVKGHPVAAPVA